MRKGKNKKAAFRLLNLKTQRKKNYGAPVSYGPKAGQVPFGKKDKNNIHALFDYMLDVYYNGI